MNQKSPVANLHAKDLIAYVNGNYMDAESAKVSPLDRGFVFGDGAYEVIPVYNGKMFQMEAHIDRLNRSLNGIRIEAPHTVSEWKNILETLIQKNKVPDQWIYLQVTRGFELVRNHALPKEIHPTIFAISYPKLLKTKEEQAKGFKITTVTDIRWKHCEIKTISRLAYVLMYQEALDAGFDDAIVINNGMALEGTSSNLFMVRHGVLMTPPKSSLILSGITRDVILQLAEKNKIPYRETKISDRDLAKADELWLTSAARGIAPVIELDGVKVGKGQAGPLWNKIWDYHAEAIAQLSL